MEDTTGKYKNCLMGEDDHSLQTKEQIKEYLWPILIFLIILIIFKTTLMFDFKPGLIVILGILSWFIKDTKSLFYMFIISLPFSGMEWTYDIGFHIRLEYILFTFVFLSFLYEKFHKGDFSFRITKIDAPLFLFLIIAVISVFQTSYISNNPAIISDAFRNYPWIKGLSRIALLIFMLLVYYVTINIIKEKEIFKKSLIFFIITSVLISVYGLAGFLFTYITSNHLPNFLDPLVVIGAMRIKSVLNEPLFLGNYLLSIIPIVYCLLAAKVDYINKKMIVIAIIILTSTLFLTVSRGAWFGYIVFLFLFVLMYWKDQKENLRILLKISFFALLALTIILLIDSTLFDLNANRRLDNVATKTIMPTISPVINAFNPSSLTFSSTEVRLWSIKIAWDAFKQHPLLGVGYSNYAFYSGMKVYKGLYLNAVNISEVNNYPISILVEMGLIGFIALIWIVISIIKSVINGISNEKNKVRKALLTGFLLSFLAVSAQLMFFSYITYAYLWVMLAMTMDLCYTKIIDLGSDSK